MILPEFSALRPAVLSSARVAASGQVVLEVHPPAGFVEGYERAGQFCKIRVEGCEGIFAMLSAPGERLARFLIRTTSPEGGEAADRLALLPDGAPIEMTLPAGGGFGLERARVRDLYFVATGTGVAPVRAALEAVLAERDAYGELTLLHGVRSDAHLAIRDDIARWRAADVDVRICFSQPTVDASTPAGLTVQAALRAHGPDLSGAAVVAVGQAEMLEALLAEVVTLGGDPELFLKNI